VCVGEKRQQLQQFPLLVHRHFFLFFVLQSTFLLVTIYWGGGGHPCTKKGTKKRKVSGDGLCVRPCVMHSLKDVRGPFFLPSTSPICLLNHSYLCSRGLDKNMKDVKRARLFFSLILCTLNFFQWLFFLLSRVWVGIWQCVYGMTCL
jgi:hypothetical protein